MTLQEFCLETISVSVGSSHWLVTIFDRLIPGWIHWICIHCVAVIAILKSKIK
jgi:hypothetical protein